MKSILVSLASVLGASSALLFACTITTTDTTPGNDAGTVTGDDGGSPGNDSAVATTDAAQTPDAADSAPPPTTNVRVGHLSPDAPAVDFCVSPHGTGIFQGPVLQTLLDGDAGVPFGIDAASTGLAFGQVTAYVAVAPGQYDVRIVAAGATSCATGIGTDTTNLPALAQDAYTTLLATGDVSVTGSDPAFAVTAHADDSVEPNGVALRFIHASPSIPAVDVGEGSLAATTFQPLFTGIAFGAAGAQAGSDAGVVDTNGYLTLGTLSSQAMSAHVSNGSVDTITAPSVSLASGSIATLFLIGAKTGDPTHALQLLLCNDNAPSIGVFTDCSVVSPAP